MAFASPIRFSPEVEEIKPDEGETIAGLNEAFGKVLTTARDYGQGVRAVHAKAHGILTGTLTVLPGLPAELAQGMFAAPGGASVCDPAVDECEGYPAGCDQPAAGAGAEGARCGGGQAAGCGGDDAGFHHGERAGVPGADG